MRFVVEFRQATKLFDKNSKTVKFLFRDFTHQFVKTLI